MKKKRESRWYSVTLAAMSMNCACLRGYRPTHVADAKKRELTSDTGAGLTAPQTAKISLCTRPVLPFLMCFNTRSGDSLNFVPKHI
jgi:hypothetical protein